MDTCEKTALFLGTKYWIYRALLVMIKMQKA